MYDYLIVGAGLFGCVFAHEAHRRGSSCLILERRDHIGGNCHTRQMAGINVHWYGPHIFHTADDEVWNFMLQFCQFNNYVNSPVANYRGTLYNLPFNMNTFTKLWPDVKTPADARRRIAEQQAASIGAAEPRNLEEQALRLVGRDIYQRLVKGYSEKQWGKPATQIPPSVIKRLPLRFTFDNNYFTDPHQGIPVGGYTPVFEQMLGGIEVRLGVDFLKHRDLYMPLARRIVYTGPIDAWFNYCYGNLEFRSLRFDHILMKGVDNFQGNAVFNYTDPDVPYTRTIEHKHFEPATLPDTVVSYEYPQEWRHGDNPCYPVNNPQNETLSQRYRLLAAQHPNVSFCGRLGDYKYYDMDKVVSLALHHPWLERFR